MLIDISLIRSQSLNGKHARKIASMLEAAENYELPPIRVRRNGPAYTVVDGRHRLAAYKAVGITLIEVEVLG